LRTA
jgi:hypothetical protein